MEFVRCSKGHFYDPNVTSTCPQCAAEKQGAGGMYYQADIGATMPVYPMEECGPTEPVPQMEECGPTKPVPQMGECGPTEPVAQMGVYGPTEPLYGDVDLLHEVGGKDGLERTAPVPQWDEVVTGDFGPGSRVETYHGGTQPIPVGGIAGFMPVTGWLVCIDGPAKGTDYRVRAGYNYIGRAEHMDICVTGDNKVTYDRHAMIAYDPRDKVFFCGPVEAKNIVRLNEKMVMVPSEIHAYDVITVGITKLMFVPLCGERFNWDE